MTVKLAYNVHEAAVMLGLGEDMVKRLVRSGELQALRTKRLEEKPSGALRGGKILITADAMRQYLASLEVA